MLPSTEPDLLGKTFGPYVIRQRVGKGGMGMVYLAQDTTLDRLVAMKFLLERFTHDEEVVSRFQREARAAAKLNHPNIVQVHAVDIEANPPFIVMEYVEGSSVDHILSNQGPLPWQNALSICGQAASALGCAHEQGIIHRDIKPANIMVDASGRARVADFGIAKVMGANTTLTAAQVSLGSPCYMSPEQCGTGDIVPASDLFSLGIAVFEMITGKLPFTSETQLGLISKITRDPLPKLDQYVPGIPPIVQDFLETLTAKDPQQRYFSAAQVVEDLRAMHHGQSPPHMTSLRGQASAIDAEANTAQGTLDPAAPSLPAPMSLVDDLYAGTTAVERRVHKDNNLPKVLLGGTGVLAAIAVGVFTVYAIATRPPGEPAAPPPPRPEEEAVTPPIAEAPPVNQEPQYQPPHQPGFPPPPGSPGTPPLRGGQQPGAHPPPHPPGAYPPPHNQAQHPPLRQGPGRRP